MEKQTNTSQIPINTRTVGTPGGIYILYLEDYVHTFIRKLLPQQAEITLLGKRYEENGRSILVVSGAVQKVFSEEEANLQKYFPNCDFLGTARPELNKDGGLRLEIGLKNTSVALDDFYIYYDQNEEMQNYLVEWNLQHNTKNPREEGYEMQREYRTRAEADDAVRYGRIAQAYNREEAKVSFMWNVMNVLCLGFVMCVMVYGIISVNNYHKMQDMQETIDYCVAFIEQNMQWVTGADKSIPASAQVSADSGLQAADMASENSAGNSLQNPQELTGAEQQGGEQNIVQSVQTAEQQNEMQGMEQQSGVQDTQNMDRQSGIQSTQNAEQQSEMQNKQDAEQQSGEQNTDSQSTAQSGATSIPQYYIVEQGDTLRSISYAVYGNYSMVDEICEWNKIENPDNILCGQRLLLP